MPVANPPLNVAVLGCWHVHAKDYARSAAAHPDTTLVAAYDPDPALGRPLAEDFGVELTDDLDALLAREDVHGVTVTPRRRRTPTSSPAPWPPASTSSPRSCSPRPSRSPSASSPRPRTTGLALVVSLPRLYAGYTLAVRDLLDSGSSGP